MTLSHTMLADAVWAPKQSNRLVRPIVLAVAGSLLIALSARIQVPMWPVPVTMQTFAVLFLALTYGPRLAFSTVALYLAQGAVGLPVFASGGGLSYIVGPTGGYLVSYAVAALVVGWLARQGWGRPITRVFAAMILGSAIIYLIGAGWLAVFIGLEKAVSLGVLPFLFGDLLKALLAAAILPAIWNGYHKTGSAPRK